MRRSNYYVQALRSTSRRFSAWATVKDSRFDCLTGEYANKNRDIHAELLGLKRAAPHTRPDLKMCLAVLE
jgi:hypothetical protein